MEIFRDVCIKCTRCIYKTASELSKCCIAIVYFLLLHQGSIVCLFTSFYELLTKELFLFSELIEENEEDEELSEVEG